MMLHSTCSCDLYKPGLMLCNRITIILQPQNFTTWTFHNLISYKMLRLPDRHIKITIILQPNVDTKCSYCDIGVTKCLLRSICYEMCELRLWWQQFDDIDLNYRKQILVLCCSQSHFVKVFILFT